MLLAGVYLFVTFEKTAIDTIEPPEQVEVFAPVETLPPGAATTLPPTTTSSTTTTTAGPDEDIDSWDAVAGLFEPRCTSCHGAAVQTAGLNLSSFDTALSGGNRGPGIVPGDAAASVIVQIMEGGGHPAQLSEAELAHLVAWIDGGAVE